MEEKPCLDNLIVIGTSHISPDSLKRVYDTIIDLKPDFVAIELDKKRLFALTQKEARGPSIKDIGRLGVKGWLFAKLGGWVERSLGKKVGVSPGDEMLRAVAAAGKVQARLALIDRDIEVTLKRFNKQLTWKERWRFFVDLIKGLFGVDVMAFDISKVPSQKVVDELVNRVRDRYPSVYRVLIEERNEFMAKSLAGLMRRFPDAKIVAVVGAGHESEIPVLLKKYLNS